MKNYLYKPNAIIIGVAFTIISVLLTIGFLNSNKRYKLAKRDAEIVLINSKLETLQEWFDMFKYDTLTMTGECIMPYTDINEKLLYRSRLCEVPIGFLIDHSLEPGDHIFIYSNELPPSMQGAWVIYDMYGGNDNRIKLYSDLYLKFENLKVLIEQ